jgi:hypothetical protein
VQIHRFAAVLRPRVLSNPLPWHHVVVLLDRNPHQKKLLALEIALAEGIIEKLDQPENVFTVITFGTEVPSLLKSAVPAGAAIAVIGSDSW